MIHTVKGFGIVNKSEIDVFLELSCFSDDPADAGNSVSGSSAFSKSSHSLLQGIFPTQGSNPDLPHCRWILYQLNYQGSPQNSYSKSKKSDPKNVYKVWFYLGKILENAKYVLVTQTTSVVVSSDLPRARCRRRGHFQKVTKNNLRFMEVVCIFLAVMASHTRVCVHYVCTNHSVVSDSFRCHGL